MKRSHEGTELYRNTVDECNDYSKGESSDEKIVKNVENRNEAVI